MRIQARTSAFQSVILEIIRNKLNMMLTEIFQLRDAVDFSDYEKVTKMVLREIASNSIRSCHMSVEDARKAIALLECLDANRLTNTAGVFKPTPCNPFEDSPFK